MSLIINTNLSSMMVQLNLSKSTFSLNDAIEKMTTGYKINHAKDNAANYSIARNMSSKISAYSIAEDNASMGLDMVQTAMDSMSLISNHLSRIRDLAEQASNGTYGKDSLNAINAEVQSRTDEINRIIANTEFNGIQLLEGEKAESNVTGYFLKPVYQLSEEEAMAQGYTIIKTRDDLENIKNDLSGKYILMNDIDLNNSCLSYSKVADYTNLGEKVFSGELNGNGYVINNFKLEDSLCSGLFAEADNAIIKNLGINRTNYFGSGSYISGVLFGTASGCTISNVYVSGGKFWHTHYAGGMYGSGGSNSISDSYSDVILLEEETTGGAITRGSEGVTCENVYWNREKSTNPIFGSSTLAGATGVTAEELAALVIDPSEQPGRDVAKDIQLQIGIYGNTSSQIDLSIGGLGLSGLSISFTTQDDARNALSVIDSYLNQITKKQTEYGAVYNRLESAIESIGVSIENLTASLSTIRDADIAKVSSDYIRNQILQQASATLLATANQSPSIALQLL